MDTDNNRRIKSEFGAARHAVERGGGYDIREGRPQIRRVQVRNSEEIVLGRRPTTTTCYEFIPPKMPALHESLEDLGPNLIDKRQLLCYQCAQTFWVTTHIQLEHDTGVIRDCGYYRTVIWYEWRDPETQESDLQP